MNRNLEKLLPCYPIFIFVKIAKLTIYPTENSDSVLWMQARTIIVPFVNVIGFQPAQKLVIEENLLPNQLLLGFCGLEDNA
jgi:hypothetical protein